MQVREATERDSDAISRVAEASLEATYADALGPELVRRAAEEWYERDRLADRLGDDAVLYLVAETSDGVVGFSESELDGDEVAEVQWLHVHPDQRGHGYGARLLAETETTLRGRGAKRVEGRVLAANETGNEFYQSHGFVHTGERTLDVGDETYTERTYVKLPEDESVELTETVDTADGTLYVAYDERERGSLAPFYAAYRSPDRSERYGYYCANCGSTNTTMDAMGRVQCGDCENHRKPTRWDAAYL